MSLFLTFAFTFWIGVPLLMVSDKAVATPRINRDPPIPDPPNSSDVQQLAEALYLDRHILYEGAFPRNKKKVDVCKLSTDAAMKLCLKASRLYKYKGDYEVISNEKVTECKPFKVKLHHTLEKPAYEGVNVRKCPFQPNPLFILSGNNRVPVFTLTWSGEEKTHLHVDYYMDVFDGEI